MSYRFSWITLLVLALAGCEGTRLSQLGQDLGFGQSSTNAAGNSGQSALNSADTDTNTIRSAFSGILQENDFPRADQAQFNALETARTGAPVAWRNPDTGNSGRVVPGPGYTINGRQCREFTHTITANGTPTTFNGVACRRGDGAWGIIPS